MKSATIAFKKIGDFFSKPSGVIVLIIIAILLYVYLKGKKAGKEKATEDLREDLKTEVKDNIIMSPDGNPWNPKVITDRLYRDIYSSVFTPRDVDVYKILVSMDDDRIKAVHNDWLDRYFYEDNETLKVAINGETTLAEWGDLKDSILAKFTNLGLS
jgi:hypothetical protein